MRVCVVLSYLLVACCGALHAQPGSNAREEEEVKATWRGSSITGAILEWRAVYDSRPAVSPLAYSSKKTADGCAYTLTLQPCLEGSALAGFTDARRS